MVKRNALMLLAGLLLCTLAQAATVTAKLDRDRIVQGETVTLVIQTDDAQQSLDTDLSVLAQDFTVLDRRTETQMSIVNGRQSAVMRLMITLEPNKTGRLIIPPLRFGAETTMPIVVTVDPPPQPQPGDTPAVFIETEIEPKNGPYYVHAQLRLVVRVFYQQNLTEAAISQPDPSPASVRLLDEVPYQAERGGERYRVLERHYAIFPERSGPMSIPAMKLSGRLVERRSDRLWQPSVQGRRIEVSSEPLELAIEPRPASFQGDSWQPARALQLSQSISAGDELKVGEPVTRTVIVDAVGLEENMITEPQWPAVDAARIYPDQPQGISRNDGKWVLGHKEFRYAVVPEEPGELVLPELTVYWWDTVNNREQKAVLPEQRLSVQPSSLVPAPPPAAALPAPAELPGAPAPAASTTPEPRYWTGLTALFATLWLITSVLWWRARQPATPPTESRPQPLSEDEDSTLSELKQACEVGDAGKVRRALSRWLRDYGPAQASGSLLEFADSLSDADLRERLTALDATGFRPGNEANWDGRALWRAFSAWRKQWQSSQHQQQAPLTDLYARR